MFSCEFLIKPASAKCNIDCAYCFYKDISNRRNTKDYGFMSLETLEKIVKKAYQEIENNVIFAFQGGEPLLAGIEFYNHFFNLLEKYNINNIKTDVSIQTNGLLIDDDFAKLFKKHNVLVGVSLDGPKNIHNLFRKDYQKRPTQEKVLQAIKILQKYEVDFNILTVITKYVARNIKEIYQFFKTEDFKYLQFIEVLDRNFLQTGKERFSLSNQDYYKFLNDLFILWYSDFNNGKYISIRNFDIMIHKILGNEESIPCFSKGVCRNQNIIEANGEVFPCDFYVIDSYSLGNIMNKPIKALYENETLKYFLNESVIFPKECRQCKYFYLCRNGCRRFRVNGKYYYCEATYRFYDKYLPKLKKVASKVVNSLQKM